MTYFKSYESSDAGKASAKIESDAQNRIKTVELDAKRIKPKLGQYKKETLERLIKETRKAQDAASGSAFDKVNSLQQSFKAETNDLKKKLLAAEQKRFDDATVEARKVYQTAVAAINAEYEAVAESVDVDMYNLINNPNSPRQLLEEAYEDLIKLYEDELKKAQKEREPSADRTI